MLFNIAGAGLAIVVCLVATGGVPAALIPALVLTGAGEGLFLTPIFNTVLTGVADHHAGTASGALSTMQRLGNTVGLAVIQIPFLATYHDLRAAGTSPVSAYTRGFAAINATVAATCAVVAVLLVLLPADTSPISGRHVRAARLPGRLR